MHPVSVATIVPSNTQKPGRRQQGQLPAGQSVTVETTPPSWWDQAKEFITTLWKVDMVRRIIYGLGALLAYTGMICCFAAIPFTAGGSIAGLSIGLASLTILFQVLAVAACTTVTENEFVKKYQALLDTEKEKKDDKAYKPSFAEFYQNEAISAIFEDEKQLSQFNQKAKEGFLKLKKEHEEIVKLQQEVTNIEGEIERAEEIADAQEKNNIKTRLLEEKGAKEKQISLMINGLDSKFRQFTQEFNSMEKLIKK